MLLLDANLCLRHCSTRYIISHIAVEFRIIALPACHMHLVSCIQELTVYNSLCSDHYEVDSMLCSSKRHTPRSKYMARGIGMVHAGMLSMPAGAASMQAWLLAPGIWRISLVRIDSQEAGLDATHPVHHWLYFMYCQARQWGSHIIWFKLQLPPTLTGLEP